MSSLWKKQQQLKHLEASVTQARASWKERSVLGGATSFVYKCAVPHVLHASMAAMGLLNLAFVAANGISYPHGPLKTY